MSFAFWSCHERGKTLMRNQISDRRIPRSDALPLSHRDSMVGKAHYASHPNLDQCCVTTNPLRDGVVLWELQEKKCQRCMCQDSALEIVPPVANTQAGEISVKNCIPYFNYKFLHPTGCDSHYCATDCNVGVPHWEAKYLTKSWQYYIDPKVHFFRDFRPSSFRHNPVNDLKLLR